MFFMPCLCLGANNSTSVSKFHFKKSDFCLMIPKITFYKRAMLSFRKIA